MNPQPPTVPNRAVCAPGTVRCECAAAPFRAALHHRPCDQQQASVPKKTPAHSTWLTHHVETTRRTARADICSHCRAPILTGPDHDTVAASVHLDPTPVDPLTEVVALLGGRHTYDLHRAQIHHRDPEHIHARANTDAIHINHQCATKGAVECLF